MSKSLPTPKLLSLSLTPPPTHPPPPLPPRPLSRRSAPAPRRAVPRPACAFGRPAGCIDRPGQVAARLLHVEVGLSPCQQAVITGRLERRFPCPDHLSCGQWREDGVGDG